jgi:hypothetical protein
MLDIAQLFVGVLNSHLEKNLRQIVDGYRLRFVGLESGFTSHNLKGLRYG